MLVWALLALFLVVRTGTRDDDRGVILDHLEFGHRLLVGGDLYAPGPDGKALHPPYPPSFGLLTAPFSVLPERVARFAWGLLQVLALAAIGSRLARWLVPKVRVRSQLLIAITFAVALRYVLRDTHGGGGNLVNLALALLAMDWAGRGRELAAGLCLGFSLATKPNLALLLLLLLALGRWRTVAASVAFGFTCLCAALLALRHGFEPLRTWLEGTLSYATQQDLFATPASEFPPFTWMNQSLRCMIERVCRTTPEPWVSQVPGFVQGLGLGAGATQLIRNVASVILVLTTSLVAWKRRSAPAALPALISATLLLCLLLSPISWKAHHVAAIPALFLCVVARRWVFLASYVLLCGVGEELIGKSWKNLQQSCYFVTLGAIALWAIMLRDAWRSRQMSATVGALPQASHDQPRSV